jgi:hypothetical protein
MNNEFEGFGRKRSWSNRIIAAVCGMEMKDKREHKTRLKCGLMDYNTMY